MSQSPSVSKPIILVLTLGDYADMFSDIHANLLNQLEQKSVLKRANSANEALNLINGDSKPQGILVADEGIIKANAVADKLVKFAREGGVVVVGGLFSSFGRPNDMQKYFDKKWNLPWKIGSYHRTTLTLNSAADGLPSATLPSSYSQKAVFLSNVPSKAAWYLPTEGSVTESHVFPPSPVQNSETPVAFTKVGNGWLGYTGSVNSEEETHTVVLGMLGLL